MSSFRPLTGRRWVILKNINNFKSKKEVSFRPLTGRRWVIFCKSRRKKYEKKFPSPHGETVGYIPHRQIAFLTLSKRQFAAEKNSLKYFIQYQLLSSFKRRNFGHRLKIYRQCQFTAVIVSLQRPKSYNFFLYLVHFLI